VNAPLPPQEAAWAARVLHGHVDSIAPLRARPGASAWLRRELRELELRALRPVQFTIDDNGAAFADGRRIPCRAGSSGLVLAWHAIAAIKGGDALAVDALARGATRPGNVVHARLRRAAAAAGAIDGRLGAALASLGIERGRIVATSCAVEHVELVRCSRGFGVANTEQTPCARETGRTSTTEL